MFDLVLCLTVIVVLSVRRISTRNNSFSINNFIKDLKLQTVCLFNDTDSSSNYNIG